MKNNLNQKMYNVTLKQYSAMFKNLTRVIVFSIISVNSLFAQITVSDSANLLPNGLTRQKVQDPVALNPTTINQLLAMDAMQSPGIRQFGPQGKLNAKRFWLIKFTSYKKIEWNISLPKAGTYNVAFLINSKPGAQIKLTGPGNSFVFTVNEKGWQRTQATDILKLPAGKSFCARRQQHD